MGSARQPDKERKGVGPAGQPKKRGREARAPGLVGWARREKKWAGERGELDWLGCFPFFVFFSILFSKRILNAKEFSPKTTSIE